MRNSINIQYVILLFLSIFCALSAQSEDTTVSINICDAQMKHALLRRQEIVNMPRPSLGLLSDEARKKAHFDNKDVHLKAFDIASSQALSWISDNQKKLLKQTDPREIASYQNQYTNQCTLQVNSLNGFVDWTINGTKNPPLLSVFEEWIRKAVKGN